MDKRSSGTYPSFFKNLLLKCAEEQGLSDTDCLSELACTAVADVQICEHCCMHAADAIVLCERTPLTIRYRSLEQVKMAFHWASNSKTSADLLPAQASKRRRIGWQMGEA
jgi:hypothetical protein